MDLGQIDLLVQEGFYSNRSDLVRTAIRNQLVRHSDVVKQTITRRSLTIGLQQFAKADLERLQAAGERIRIQVVGLARIASDVPPALARATIESISVLGASMPARKCAARSRTEFFDHLSPQNANDDPNLPDRAADVRRRQHHCDDRESLRACD